MSKLTKLPHRECVRCDNQQDCNKKGFCFMAWIKNYLSKG